MLRIFASDITLNFSSTNANDETDSYVLLVISRLLELILHFIL